MKSHQMDMKAPFANLEIKDCQLCSKAPTGIDSHIVPRFISKTLIDVLIGGQHQLRSTDNPNSIQQDTLNIPFLCDECEKALNKYETLFAPRYKKYLENDPYDLEIDEQTYRLLVSISWRTARLLLLTLPPKQAEPLIAPEKAWREYLLKETEDVGPFHQYLFSARDFKEPEIYASRRLSRTHLNTLIGTGVNGFYGETQTKQALVNHLGPLILCGQMRDVEEGSPAEVEQWSNFIVQPGTVIPGLPRNLPPALVDGVDAHFEWALTRIYSMSKTQKQKQKKRADKHLKDTLAYRLIQEDERIFSSKEE